MVHPVKTLASRVSRRCFIMDNFTAAEKYFNEGKYKLADEHYTQCIINIKQHEVLTKEQIFCLSRSLNNTGQIKYLAVQFEEAIDDYRQSLIYDPNFAVALYNKGLIHYRLGRYTLAIEDFLRALELEPSFEDAQTALNIARKEQSEKGDKIWPQYTKNSD